MAKDPAFLFYPGDYLRDTQCLSENAQVAYDRIMCEHMRNICKDVSNIGITKDKLKFFTKRLNEDELNDLMNVLVKSGDIYQIEWVAISICKRKAYSENRAENRKGKKKEHMKTYDSHMVNENENINVLEGIEGVGEKGDNGTTKHESKIVGTDLAIDTAKQVWADQRWIENVCIGNQLNPEDLKKWMAQFNASICNDVMPDFDAAKYKKLFGGWLNRQRAKGYKLPYTSVQQKSTPTLITL